MIDFDFHNTIAKLALKTDARRPEIFDKIEISRGTNPIFIFQKKDYIPIDINMNSKCRTILISGPNAGGKTIAIKTLALFATMNQSGIFIPALVARLPIFDNIFVDIGDSQSLEDDLSTFTGHVKNIKYITEKSTKSSLILIDEIGSGTEPETGAGIAEAILENLHKRECYILVTTHFTSLKKWANETDGADNAGMGIEIGNMMPSYKIIFGTPGASYGLEIANIAGLNKEIIKKAESLIKSGSTRLDNLIADIESQTDRLNKKIKDLKSKEYQIDSIRHKTEFMKEQTEKIFKSSKRNAALESKIYLDSQRKKIESIIKDIRTKGASKESINKAKLILEDSSKKITKDIEENISVDFIPLEINDINIDMNVYYSDINEHGIVDRMPDKKGKVSVSINGKSILIHHKKLSISKNNLKPSQPDSHKFEISAPPGMRIDIRGLRMNEAINKLDKFIDSSVAYGMNIIEILHGKGEGILMQAVHKHLSEQKHVKEFRFADEDSGGSGITIAKL